MKYKKKPLLIQAIQFTGDNDSELANFGCDFHRNAIYQKCSYITNSKGTTESLHEGDFVIKELATGKFDICKPNIFEATYEAVNE